MTASTRREPLTALDQLTDGLVPAADRLAGKLDRLADLATGRGTTRIADVCPWCLEAGGPHRCEYQHEAAEALDEFYDAPTIHFGRSS